MKASSSSPVRALGPRSWRFDRKVPPVGEDDLESGQPETDRKGSRLDDA